MGKSSKLATELLRALEGRCPPPTKRFPHGTVLAMLSSPAAAHKFVKIHSNMFVQM